MFGAPFGGTIRVCHHALDWAALREILPPNGSGGGGKTLPSIDRVAFGDPSMPVISWGLVEFPWALAVIGIEPKSAGKAPPAARPAMVRPPPRNSRLVKHLRLRFANA